jgi:hypothetical protein
MRDPDLVQRAERAAMALERAWGHWRVMHGLGTDPLPPVSSYVGYSLEEPWGQPRVVFGVGAEEAERLAALLAGHDCYGPVHAEVTARPDWRLAASAGPATAQGRPFDGGVSVPAQAPPPGAEPAAERDGWHLTAAADAEEVDGGPAGVGLYQAEPTVMDSGTRRGYWPGQNEAEPLGGPASPTPAEPASALPTAAAAGPDELDPLPADPHEPPWLSGAQDGGDRGQAELDPGLPYSDQRGGAGQASSIPPPAESWQQGEPAGTVELAAVEQPGVIAFPRRPQQPADQWQEPMPAASPASDSYDATPSQGPGYRGPRYQGFPPQYQSGPSQQEPPALFGSLPEAEPAGAGESGARQASAAGPRAVRPVAEQAGSGPGAGQPGATEPEAVQADATPAVVRAKAGPSGGSEPASGEPEAVQSAAVQSRVAQSKGGQSGVRQSKARHVSVEAREAGRPGADQSREGRSREGQPDPVQPSTVPSGTGPEPRQPRVSQPRATQPKAVPLKPVPSKPVQPKPAQPKAVPSKSGQSRPTSRPSSPGRTTGEGTGKRPQD